ncbi:MAG TPA: thioesterase family protein [Gammaproteobacteria bacterium]|nr:thioesterase family protein [Gammaproteobacteria bacterium]
MAEPIEVYRNSVQTWETDQMGHMNVQFYVDKSAAALAVLSHHLGLGPDFTRQAGARLSACEHHIRFLREQHPGAPLRMTAGVLSSGPERLRLYQEMTNAASGEVAATFIVEAELLDTATRAVQPLPAATQAAAEGLRIELPAHGAPRGLTAHPPRPSPTLAEAEALGLLATYHGAVAPTMCDVDGWLATRAYMGIVSDAVPNLLVQIYGIDRSKSGIGGAALEYRFAYRKALRAGDLITVRSGIKQVASKTYTFSHWLFDLTTGEAIATAEVVAVMLDLQERRAIEIPAAVREMLERHLKPGIGI